MSLEGLGLLACGGADGVLDGFAAGAQLGDAFLGEGDDRMAGVIVLLHAQRLPIPGLVDVFQLGPESLELLGVLVALIAGVARKFVVGVKPLDVVTPAVQESSISSSGSALILL